MRADLQEVVLFVVVPFEVVLEIIEEEVALVHQLGVGLQLAQNEVLPKALVKQLGVGL